MTVPMPNESYDWAAAQARLEQAAEREHPTAWVPTEPGTEGATIMGRVVEVQPAVHTAFGDVPVVTLEGPNGGRRCVWLHHAVLRRAFIRADVQLGEVVLIRSLGKVPAAGGGNPYADYRLEVDRSAGSGAAPGWATIAKQHEDDVADPAIAAAAPPDVDEVRHTVPAGAGTGHVDTTGDAALTAQQQVESAAAADDDIPF